MLPASNGKLQKAQQVEQELRSVLATDPTDERTYVVLGTLLLRQRRIEEARAVYEEGCAIAEGKNAYIWTAMANLERKVRSLSLRLECAAQLAATATGSPVTVPLCAAAHITTQSPSLIMASVVRVDRHHSVSVSFNTVCQRCC